MGRRRWLAWVPALGPLVVFATAIVGRRTLFPGDSFTNVVPQKILAARIVAAGHLPTWNPYAFGGYPLLATGQVAVFYPATWLFAVLPGVLAANLTVVSTFVIAGTGAFFLARRLCGDEAGAVVAGLAFGLSGFLFAHLTHQAIIATVAWLPWALLAFERLVERFSPGRLLAGAGVLALALAAGHGQMFFFVVAVLGLYAIVVATAGLRAHKGRPVLLAVVMVAAGMALGAAQLVPTAAIVGSSDRNRVDYRTATSFSFPGSHSVLVAFPYLFGNEVAAGPYTARYRGKWNHPEMSGYPGMVALGLAAVGVVAARRDRRALALATVGVVTLVAALGSLTPLGKLVYALPVYGQFRSWARYIVGFDLAVALLAAYGVARLRAAAGRGGAMRVGLPALAVTAAVAVTALVLPHVGGLRAFMASGSTRTFALVAPAAAALLGAACCLLFTRAPRLATAAVAVAVALDAFFVFGAWFQWRNGSPSPAGFRRLTSAAVAPPWGPVGDRAGGISRFVYAGRDFAARSSYPDVTDLQGLRSANGFDPLAPRAYLEGLSMDYLGLVDRPERLWRPQSHLLDLMRVGVVLVDPRSTRPLPGPDSLLPTPGQPAGTTALVRHDYQPRLADAFLVGATDKMSRGDAIRRLAGEVPFDPATTSAVQGPCSGCPGPESPGPAGSVGERRWGPTTVRVDLTADRPALLVLSQSWFPGWTATVDGRSTAVVRADAVAQGVAVGPGRHTVVLRYRAPGLRLGVALSGLTLAGLTAWTVADRRRRRAHPPGAGPEPIPEGAGG